MHVGYEIEDFTKVVIQFCSFCWLLYHVVWYVGGGICWNIHGLPLS